MNLELGEDLGVIQDIDIEKEQEILDLIKEARLYMQNTVYKDPNYASVKDNCRNQDESCAFWAAAGECKDNAGYMNVSCAPMCQTCEYIDFKKRCPVDANAPNIWAPGDLNKMFERIVNEPEFQKYDPVVLSRPDYAPGDTEETASYLVGGPWIITLENVVSPEESKRLIELGAEEGYKPSADVGELKFDGTFDVDINEGRTSTNAWCGELCYADPIAKLVMERLENITQIPDQNTEYLQLLRYEVGQFYQTHHDYIEFDVDRQNGVRILTVFLYLNEVEAGGGTNFPQLDLTVYPKLGRVLLWPSVLDEDPHAKDFRTDHQALPVEKGIKYGKWLWKDIRLLSLKQGVHSQYAAKYGRSERLDASTGLQNTALQELHLVSFQSNLVATYLLAVRCEVLGPMISCKMNRISLKRQFVLRFQPKPAPS